MKLNCKKVVMLVMVVAMAATTIMGCSKLNDDDIVATVGADKITLGVANFYARFQQAQYETYYASFMGDDMWNTEVSDGVTYEESIKSSTLTTLQNMYLLKQHMADYKVEVTEDDKTAIKKAASQFVEDNALESKAVVSGNLETVKEYLNLLTIQSKMFAPMTADVNSEVSDEEAAQKSMQYLEFAFTTTDADGNSKTLTDAEKATLKETASSFLEGAKTAADFNAYATAAGYAVSTATFDAKATTPNAELVAAADALEEGGITGIVETDAGYYVAKVTSLLDRTATDAKKESIVSQRKQDQYNTLLEKWKSDIEIKVNKKVWAKVGFQKQGVTMKQSEEQPYATGASDTTTTE